MTDQNIQFKKNIMRRVYAIWFFRKVVNIHSLKIFLLLLFGWQITLYVSFSSVASNFPSFFNIPSLYGFITEAFLNTEIVVMIFFVFIAVLIFLLAKDLLGNIFNFKIFNIPLKIKGRFN